MQLRDHCQKIRIHTQLSGAHMIFPQEQGLAIRCYYHPPTQYIDDNSHIDTDNENDITDPDGILDFCYTFQWSMVLFVVPDILTSEENDMHLFVQRSMQLLDLPIPTTGSNKQHHRPPRFLVVTNTELAIAAIMECADAITPSRCALRAKYIENIRIQHYVPNNVQDHANNGSSSNSKEKGPSTPAVPVDTTIHENAVAEHYAKAIREWCDRANVPDGEADVILHVLPTLHQLLHAVTDHNSDALMNHVPIEENTKRKLRYFFTARDGDDDTNYYSTDHCLDGNTHIDQVDTSNFQNVVKSPPSVPLTGQYTNVFQDPTNADMAFLQSQYHHQHTQPGERPYVMTQEGMDVDDVFPIATGTAPQFYHPQSSGWNRPSPPRQHVGNFQQHSFDPSLYPPYHHGGMPQIVHVGPGSGQQYHRYMTAPSNFPPPLEHHHPPHIYALPYRGHPSTMTQPPPYSHNVHSRNPLHDVERMAKVVPWGQAIPAMPSSTVNTPHSQQQQHHHQMCHPAPPPASTIPEHWHPPPPTTTTSRRVSLSPYAAAPSLNRFQHPPPPPQQRPFHRATPASTVQTPHHRGNPQQYRNGNDDNHSSSLKKVVRRFM
jgi:hypothetical protein